MNSLTSVRSLIGFLLLTLLGNGQFPALASAQDAEAAKDPKASATGDSPAATSPAPRLKIVIAPGLQLAGATAKAAEQVLDLGIGARLLSEESLPKESAALIVNLSVDATQPHDKVMALLKELSSLPNVPSLHVALAASQSAGNRISIAANAGVPIDELNRVYAFLIEQQILEATVAPVPLPIRITMLRVKSDWSQVPNAKAIGEELRAALKDAGLPTELLDKLPASGPQVFFAPEVVSLYEASHLTEMLAWMHSNELITKSQELDKLSESLQSAASSSGQPVGSTSAGGSIGLDSPAHSVTCTTDMALDELDLPPLPQVVSQPFVTRKPHLFWRFRYQQSEDGKFGGLQIRRRVMVMERTRGATEATVTNNLEESTVGISLSESNVAVINAFPILDEAAYREAANRQGYELVFVVERGPHLRQLGKVEARLHLPDRVYPVARESGNKGISWANSGRGSRGATTSSSMMMRPGMGSMPAVGSRGQSSGMSGFGQSSRRETTLKPEVETNSTRIYRLKHVSATALADIVRLLFPKTEITAAADTGTNSLIVRGPQSAFDNLNEIISGLDEPPARVGTSATGQGSPDGDTVSFTEKARSTSEQLAANRQAYERAEKQSLDLAAAARQQSTHLAPADPQIQQLRNELQQAVSNAFGVRQRILQQEVADIQQRAKQIQQSIELRDRMQKQIIDRRVTDLLNPELKWDTSAESATSSTGSPVVMTAPASLKGASLGANPLTVVTPKKPAPQRSPVKSNPVSAVVWLEVLRKGDSQAQKPRSAYYLNGCLVSSDGLIATVVGRDEQVNDVLSGENTVNVFIGTSEVERAELVAYMPKTGLALLQIPGGNRPCFEISNIAPAINQRLNHCYRLGRKEGDWTEAATEVSNVPSAADAEGRNFCVNRAGETSQMGSPLLNSVGELQGIMAQWKATPPRGPMDEEEPIQRGPTESHFIPGLAISEFIETYRTQAAAKPVNSARPTTGVATRDTAQIREVPGAPQTTAQAANFDPIQVDPALSGVWELNYTEQDRNKVPDDRWLRIVVFQNHMATFQGGRRTSSWVVQTDPSVSPARISMEVCEGQASGYGYYEVQGDSMRLAISPDPNLPFTKFGTERPEFVRVSRDVSFTLQESLRQIPPPRQTGPARAEAPIRIQAILFDADSQAAEKFGGIPTNGKATATVPVYDFDQRLAEAGAFGSVKIFSRPQVLTLPGQTATIEMGTTADSGSPEVTVLFGQQEGTRVELHPYRDQGKMLLDIAVQITEKSELQPEIKLGNTSIPSFEVRNYQATAGLTGGGRILMTCPARSEMSTRVTFLYLEVSTPVPAASAAPLPQPSPTASEPVRATRDPNWNSLILRNAEDYRKLLDEVGGPLAEMESSINLTLKELQKTNPNATVEYLKRMEGEPSSKLLKEVERSKQRLQVIRDELATQISLLEQELMAAKASLEAAEKGFARMTALGARGYASEADKDQANVIHQQAKRRVDVIKTLLDLYQKVDPMPSPTTSSGRN